MTTIVYCDKTKQIACDSRTTLGDIVIDSCAIKYKITKDKVWFCAGNKGDADTFIQHYEPLIEANKNLSVDAIFVITSGECAKGVYMTTIDNNNIYRECILDHNYATGSGYTWAMSALDHGKTAKEAVEYAMTRDIYSGGKVHVYDIVKSEFT